MKGGQLWRRACVLVLFVTIPDIARSGPSGPQTPPDRQIQLVENAEKGALLFQIVVVCAILRKREDEVYPGRICMAYSGGRRGHCLNTTTPPTWGLAYRVECANLGRVSGRPAQGQAGR